ncbi:MAG: LysR family transcriptional regulator [Verrucomicrobia bacterium]|nr:LysR family transcriptional regulator [Verrucomicrobiota bacterium]
MTAFDDLSLLRTFVCIVESGSISAAARRLKDAQSTLSRQLRLLEKHSGAALLRRDTHGMSLTESGQRLLLDARNMLAHAEEADQRLREGQTTLSGHLRLFATIDLGQSIVTRLVSRFLQINPNVTAELGLSSRPLRMIQEGCDVAMLPGKITDESVIARPVGQMVLQLAASPSLVKVRPPVKEPADLEAWPWITVGGHQFWNTKELTLSARNRPDQTIHLSPLLISEGVTSIREAVRDGLGVSVLPEFLIREDVRRGRLVRLLPQWSPPCLPVHVVYAGARLLPTRVRAFVDFAVSYITTELRSKP